MFVTRDPSTGETVRELAGHTPDEVEARVVAAASAFVTWRDVPFAERADRLRAAARLLRLRSGEWASLMAEEMGKPVAQGRAEAEKCAWACEHYAQHGEALLAPDLADTGAARSFVRYDPLGPILAIMPWNFPFWQFFRFAAPALMAGNTALLKHTTHTPGCGLAIEEIFREAGFPFGAVLGLLVDHDAVAELLADPRVAAATLTGSSRAGASVGATAGRAIKPVVLELGGSDPYVVLADADVEAAARAAVNARVQNSGQSCIAAKRFIVERAVSDTFLARFREGLAAVRVGDPRDEATQMGPLAREDLRDGLHDQVERSVAAGARCLLGGVKPEGRGFFYPVTLLADVAPGMPAWDEETFGPVAAVRVVDGEEEAIAAANDSVYGLGASLWTRDLDRADRLARRIDAGCVFVNAMVKSDPRVPFGGIKQSGYGRELGRLGMLEFVNAKTVWMER